MREPLSEVRHLPLHGHSLRRELVQPINRIEQIRDGGAALLWRDVREQF